MRDPQVIASEIDQARHDLDLSLGELKALVKSKLDLKQRARHAVSRGLDEARSLVQRARDTLRRHPAVTAVAVGLVLTAGFLYVRWRRQRWLR